MLRRPGMMGMGNVMSVGSSLRQPQPLQVPDHLRAIAAGEANQPGNPELDKLGPEIDRAVRHANPTHPQIEAPDSSLPPVDYGRRGSHDVPHDPNGGPTAAGAEARERRVRSMENVGRYVTPGLDILSNALYLGSKRSKKKPLKDAKGNIMRDAMGKVKKGRKHKGSGLGMAAASMVGPVGNMIFEALANKHIG